MPNDAPERQELRQPSGVGGGAIGVDHRLKECVPKHWVAAAGVDEGVPVRGPDVGKGVEDFQINFAHQTLFWRKR